MTQDEARDLSARVKKMSAQQLNSLIAIFEQEGDIYYEQKLISNRLRKILLKTMKKKAEESDDSDDSSD